MAYILWLLLLLSYFWLLVLINTYYDMSSKGYTTFLTCHVALSTQYLDLRAGDMFCSAPLGTSIDDGFPIVQWVRNCSPKERQSRTCILIYIYMIIKYNIYIYIYIHIMAYRSISFTSPSLHFIRSSVATRLWIIPSGGTMVNPMWNGKRCWLHSLWWQFIVIVVAYYSS
jgi:hypothetical protein